MYPHRIRLRGPWEFEPLSTADEPAKLPQRGRVVLPAQIDDGPLAGLHGKVRFLRPFGAPSRLDDSERLWLTIHGLGLRADIGLNDSPLGTIEPTSEPVELEIGRILQPRNELAVDIDIRDCRTWPWQEIALEIRRSAFLRQIRVRQLDRAALAVSGVVIAESPVPLEIVVRDAKRSLACLPVEFPEDPARHGRLAATWELECTWANRAGAVHVELRDASTLWYEAVAPINDIERDAEKTTI
jgi:hypothetical protein